MTASTIDSPPTVALRIEITEDTLIAELADGRSVSVPLAWYPRLMHATEGERTNSRLIGGGQGMHWPDLDEDVSIENLLSGKPSAESPRSLQRWLAARG